MDEMQGRKFVASIWILAKDFARICGFSSIVIVGCTLLQESTWILVNLLAKKIVARMDSRILFEFLTLNL